VTPTGQHQARTAGQVCHCRAFLGLGDADTLIQNSTTGADGETFPRRSDVAYRWRAGGTGRPAGSLAAVRLTEFWSRMRAQFGESYADSVARDHVLTVLGGRTVNQALDDGEDVKVIWGAICETFKVPSGLR
jgi:hypothetical protein